MKISRRFFLKQSGLAVFGLNFLPGLFEKQLLALTEGNPSKTLVVIFQRGAMDGLSMVPPLGDIDYYTARPNIALKPSADSGVIRLDNYFGLHPALSPLKSFWDEGTLAFVHEVGSPDPTRSHFDAQDFMEIGIGGDKNGQEGFLNRAAALFPDQNRSPVKAVALQPNMPRILQGKFPAISMNSLNDFEIKGGFSTEKEAHGFETMYQQAANHALRGVGKEIAEALGAVRKTASQIKKNENYPRNPTANRLREIAELIKANLGLQIAVTDMGGWDTHVHQGNQTGQLANKFNELGSAIAAFAKDLGPKLNDVVLMTVTEFGRTVKENGNRGTDHGHGSVAMVLGGSVKGKKVYGKYRELKPENLFEGRDIPVTTDYRDLFAEVLKNHLGLAKLETVFPKHKIDTGKLGMFRT